MAGQPVWNQTTATFAVSKSHLLADARFAKLLFHNQRWSRSGAPEWTPGRVYDFCQSRSRTWRRSFEWKPDPEQEWEFQFLQESNNWFY